MLCDSDLEGGPRDWIRHYAELTKASMGSGSGVKTLSILIVWRYCRIPEWAFPVQKSVGVSE